MDEAIKKEIENISLKIKDIFNESDFDFSVIVNIVSIDKKQMAKISTFTNMSDNEILQVFKEQIKEIEIKNYICDILH